MLHFYCFFTKSIKFISLQSYKIVQCFIFSSHGPGCTWVRSIYSQTNNHVSDELLPLKIQIDDPIANFAICKIACLTPEAASFQNCRHHAQQRYRSQERKICPGTWKLE